MVEQIGVPGMWITAYCQQRRVGNVAGLLSVPGVFVRVFDSGTAQAAGVHTMKATAVDKRELYSRREYAQGRDAYPAGSDASSIGVPCPIKSELGKTAWWMGWLDARTEEKWGPL